MSSSIVEGWHSSPESACQWRRMRHGHPPSNERADAHACDPIRPTMDARTLRTLIIRPTRSTYPGPVGVDLNHAVGGILLRFAGPTLISG